MHFCVVRLKLVIRIGFERFLLLSIVAMLTFVNEFAWMFASFEHMLTQIVESTATKETVAALERFFSCMCAQVTFQMPLDARLKFTLVTCKPFGWRKMSAGVPVIRKREVRRPL